jgi:hypothetical protein
MRRIFIAIAVDAIALTAICWYLGRPVRYTTFSVSGTDGTTVFEALGDSTSADGARCSATESA